MEEFDLEDINYLVRVHIQGAHDGDIFVADIGDQSRSWRPELGGGDMTAHGRIVRRRRIQLEVGRTRRVMKKFLNMATFAFVVPILLVVAAFLVSDVGVIISSMSFSQEYNAISDKIKFHMQGCLDKSYYFSNQIRIINEELYNLYYRNQSSPEILKQIGALSQFYDGLISELTGLKIKIKKLSNPKENFEEENR